jgi:hypothetical protein
MLKDNPFENVRNQIGYCGIWCGSCVVGNGVLRELTRRYAEIVENYGLEGWGPKDFDYKEFKKGLASICAMPLCDGCLKGGGKDDCQLRACAQAKGINGCSKCGTPEECGNKEELQHMRTGALKAGLLVQVENVDQKELLKKWKKELKKKWPSCILFMNDE